MSKFERVHELAGFESKVAYDLWLLFQECQTVGEYFIVRAWMREELLSYNDRMKLYDFTAETIERLYSD